VLTGSGRGMADTIARPASWTVAGHEPFDYDVRVSEPLLADDNRDLLIGGRVPGRRFVIVDDGLPVRCRRELSEYFAAHGIDTRVKVLHGGESCKTLDVVAELLTEMEEFGLERREEPVVVVGGGAVLDVGGFAASIYRRGVPFVRVPTTLLAYVDAAVGVKTGVNFAGRKNLVGAFAAPRVVLLERAFLLSLPEREISSGLGEVLKLGVGCHAALFETLEERAEQIGPDWLAGSEGAELLESSIEIMLRELEPNLLEGELRRAVDLGHTFSQAFEMQPGERALRHGEAVAIDLNLSATIAAERMLLGQDDVDRLTRLTRRLGLPSGAPPIDPAELWDSLLDRKRHRGGRQCVPLPQGFGRCTFVDDLTRGEVEAALEVVSRPGR
jgi:3-dehydroquinate synthetase